MTPELAAFVRRINELNSIEARNRLRGLDDETLIDITWTLCSQVQKQADIINSAAKILTD